MQEVHAFHVALITDGIAFSQLKSKAGIPFHVKAMEQVLPRAQHVDANVRAVVRIEMLITRDFSNITGTVREDNTHCRFIQLK